MEGRVRYNSSGIHIYVACVNAEALIELADRLRRLFVYAAGMDVRTYPTTYVLFDYRLSHI